MFCLSLLIAFAGCASTVQYTVGADGTPEDRASAERSFANKDPVQVSGGSPLDRPPRVISSRFPEYPRHLTRREVAGSVVVEFTVDETGKVIRPTVKGTPAPELAELVVGAITQWQFEPATKGGSPVRVRVRHEFVFKVE